MQEQDFEIAGWFAGYLAGDLSDEQRCRLEAWIDESEENRLLFRRVCTEERFGEWQRMAAAYDKRKGWQKVAAAIPATGKVRQRWIWFGRAAVIALTAGICCLLMLRAGTQAEPEPAKVVKAGQPGSSKAILTLADGSVVDLEETKAFRLQEKDGTRIEKDSAALSYKAVAKETTVQKIVYNKMTTPRGGEYSLVLSDGTEVFLNAMSELRFPVNFGTKVREVELSGEAYFNVQPDANRPFIIKTGDLQIRVLGTQFNVCAYREEHVVKTTLVEGRVELAGKTGETVVLHPSQQAVFAKEGGAIEVKEVDVASAIAWKNGMFDIRDCRLEEIMEYLSRWYSVHVFYQKESLKDIRFGCYIARYSEIGQILELLEKTQKIRAQLKGNTVVFSER